MDRLLCGDVGYGKTEVAMRAVFKCVLDGKQAAILAPTTILADQHHRTLRRRFAAFPVTIDLLSRFRNADEQKEVVRRLAEGTLDVVVGTHRILSKDVSFKDLGLVVIDEEQRFGVAQKEKLKELRASVEVLSMSATPIPRSLNLALGGIRDLSVIETPPKDRLAIATHVVAQGDEVVQGGDPRRAGPGRAGLRRPQPDRGARRLARAARRARARSAASSSGTARCRRGSWSGRCAPSRRARPTSSSPRRSSRTASTSRRRTR